jgi:hypothetical protein
MLKNTTLVNIQRMNLVVLMKNKELQILNKNEFYITVFRRIVMFLTDLSRWLIITFLGGSLTMVLFLSEVKPVKALELDEDTRTVTLDPKGNTVVMTPEQVKRGKRLFNNACGTCHVGGLTKTNPNVGLDTNHLV